MISFRSQSIHEDIRMYLCGPTACARSGAWSYRTKNLSSLSFCSVLRVVIEYDYPFFIAHAARHVVRGTACAAWHGT